MKRDFRRVFIPDDTIQELQGLGAARGLAIGGLVGGAVWLLIALALSIFLSCA